MESLIVRRTPLVAGHRRLWSRVALGLALGALVMGAAACEGDDDDGQDGADGPPDLQQPIVYEATAEDGSVNVFTIDADSGQPTQVTTGPGFSGHPAFSPDYTRIVFASDRENEPRRHDLWTVARDGTDLRRVAATDTIEWTPKFSPDGELIAYIEVTDDEGSFIGLMNPDGSEPRRFAGPYRFAEFPAWTRDGGEIFVSAIPMGADNADIFAVDLETGEQRTVIATPAPDVCPHFSRDGTILSYASVAAGPENQGNVDLFAHDLSSDDTTGADDIRLTTNAAVDDYGNPSPDGNTWVFVSRRDGNNELYLMDPDGGNQRRLTSTPNLRENVPDW